jgi:amino acid efflux transporter
VVLFFAFAGWEAVAHLAGEFRDVRRDLSRATVLTVGIVGMLYLGVAVAVIATGSYGTDPLDRIAIGRVLGVSLGVSASTAAAILATVISLGTTNAFMASVSRLGYALARDGWLPDSLRRQSPRGVPTTSVLTVAGIGAAGLAATYLAGWGTEDLVGVPASLVLVTYLIGTAAGIRLLTGRARMSAAIAFAATAAVAPFAATFIAVPVIVAAVAAGYRWLRRAAAQRDS